MGHGAFGLKHSFLPEYGIADIYGNLMGYGDSSYLCKFQWDIIHNSKAGETAFDTVSDVMLTTRDECSKYIEILKESRTKGKKLPLNLHKDSIYVSENIKIDTFTYKKITLYVDNARNADVEEVDMSSTELYKREGTWSVYGKDYHFIIRPYRIMLTFKTEKERDVMFDYLGGEKDEKEYLPWMNYAITEAKTMNNVSECEEPLFSKGKSYHQDGAHANFCPCGIKTHGNYCEPNAWCASFTNWCLRKSQTSYTKSAGSQTFLNHGDFIQIYEPIFGAIAVFTNLDSKGHLKTTGHVAFVVGIMEGEYLLCLGGNQGNRIKVSKYSLEKDKKEMGNKLYFKGYYIPKEYANKLEKHNTTIVNYTDDKTANQQIINLTIKQIDNESTR